MSNGTRKDWTAARQEARERLTWLLAKDGGRLKQRELSERMNMTQSVLSRIMSGELENSPSPVVCALVAYIWRERRAEMGLDDPKAIAA